MATPIPANAAPLTAFSAAAATGGTVLRVGPAVRTAIGITTDSRAVQVDSAFLALRGEKHDGHDHLAEAMRRGASLLIVERGLAPVHAEADIVEVEDGLAAWADIARAHVRAWRRNRADALVIAITGSAGKTTTKELCAALLRASDACHATSGNLNNRVGLPATALCLTPGHRFAVFEVGMSLRGEIAQLARVLEPDVAVLTNIGVAHAAGVGGTRGDVAREKGDLLASLDERGTAIVRYEDAAAMGQLARTRARHVRTFGLSDGADYRVERRTVGLVEGEAMARVVVYRSGQDSLHAELPLLGEAAALDFVAAVAATESVAGRLDQRTVERALREHFERPAGRMQARRLANGAMIIDDTYNANPESVRSALHTLAEVAGTAGPSSS